MGNLCCAASEASPAPVKCNCQVEEPPIVMEDGTIMGVSRDIACVHDLQLDE